MRVVLVVLLVYSLGLGTVGCSTDVGKEPSVPQQQETGVQQNPQSSTSQGSGSKEISVIAKSGSQAPSDEKEAVLDDITRELDEILNNANSLDEVAETDFN